MTGNRNGNWNFDTNGVVRRVRGGGNLRYKANALPDDFELRFEWKVANGSNSGVYYRPGQYEYQILDNDGHKDGKNPRTSAAALYFCMAPALDRTRPVGTWNHGRVVCKGTVIQHWLNGSKILDFDYKDPRWKSNVELLRLRGADLEQRGGHLWLQDHGDEVAFRNILVRPVLAHEDINHQSITPAKIPMEIRAAEQKKLDGILKRRRSNK